ncbi:hypothetical protein IscW_ISCW020860, partial [Ixodes scapularis]
VVSLLYSKNKRKSFTFLEHSETIHRTYTLGVPGSPHLFPNGLCLWCRQKYRENKRPPGEGRYALEEETTKKIGIVQRKGYKIPTRHVQLHPVQAQSMFHHRTR